MSDAWPRQPRRGLGCADNGARVVQHGSPHGYFGVECRQCDGSWAEVARFDGLASATTMKRNLGWVFSHPGADLDFITPTAFPGGQYAVVWPVVTWDRSHQTKTKAGNCSGRNPAVTYESLYKANHVFAIKKVKDVDIKRYRTHAFRIAFEWANNIRRAVNGWNCTKDARNYPLIANGTIPVQPPAARWDFTPSREEATVYGLGECQPNFQTANGEIFHCLDLGIAVPGPRHTQHRWALNQWVKVTYPPSGKSVHARLVDVCGCNGVDLSRGVAQAVGFPGGRRHVVISRP